MPSSKKPKRKPADKPPAQSLKHAVPPPDNPRLRFRETEVEPFVGDENDNAAALAEDTNIAERRAAAFEQAKQLPTSDEEVGTPSSEEN